MTDGNPRRPGVWIHMALVTRERALLGKYGPWALVTGASSGIGAEFARQLAARGFHLVLVARRRQRLDELGAQLVRQHAVAVKVVAVDLGTPGFMDRIREATREIEIGLLVNNAGFGVAGRFLENRLERELELLDVNCRAPLILSHVFGQEMVARGHGGIVFVSSVVGFLTMPFMSHYAASKAYGLLFGEGLGFELERFGVDVLVVCPGGTETEFQEVAGVRWVSAMKVAPVVSQALRALGKKPTVIAGLQNQLFIGMARFAPRRLMTRILGSAFENLRRNSGKNENPGNSG